MADHCSFRQVEEKHVSVKLHLLEWSPKMDLLALSNIQGEVVLHRLSWQKVWTLKPPAEEVRVTSLAWRPDGKVLAVGYTDGKVLLCDVENSSTVHSLVFDEPVSCLKWISESADSNSENETEIFTEKSTEYLPKLHPLTKSYGGVSKGHGEENVDDAKKLKDQNNLNVLLVGSQFGVVHLYVYGILGVGTIQLAQHGENMAGSLSSATLSDDLKILSVCLECHRDDSDAVTSNLLTFDTTLLASRRNELRILAQKFGLVQTLISYMQLVIKQMTEAWEDILLETDSKLLKFAEEKYKLCSGSVSTDFLELLMFGTPSDELKMFLLHDLTDKGLKKLGHSLDTSYSNIQQLVLKNLQVVAQAIFYHLDDLRAMSCWYERFGVLGLQTTLLDDALSVAGGLMLKASQLQLVIDRSMKNFKAFFRWLYVEIQKLADEPVPPELSKMTQQDVNFVAEFLKENFTEEMDGSKSGFKLEKVGQYLKDEELSVLPDDGHNIWTAHIETNPVLKDCKVFYKADVKKSLIQVQKLLERQIENAMNKPAMVIGQSLQCLGSWTLCDHPDIDRFDTKTFMPTPKQFTSRVGGVTYVYTICVDSMAPCDKLLLVRQQTDRSHINPQCVYFKFGELDGDESGCIQHTVLDFGYYNESVISVLLHQDTEDGLSIMAQIPFTELTDDHFSPLLGSTTSAVDRHINSVDICPNIEKENIHKLKYMKVQMFVVSGSRKVGCVVASSRRRVRLFLMDVDEDDEDDEHNESSMIQDDSQNALEESVSMTISDENKENTSLSV